MIRSTSLKVVMALTVFAALHGGVCGGASESTSVMPRIRELLRRRAELTDPRRERMIQAAEDALRGHEPLSDDKRAHFDGECTQYFDDVLASAPLLDDSQFQVIVDRFGWNLANVVSLPPIDDAGRRAAGQDARAIGDAVKRLVDNTYADTPAPVRERIVLKSREGLVKRATQWASYFYPETLYVPGDALSAENVYAHLVHSPLLNNNASKFARVTAILQDRTIPPPSAQFHVQFFVNDEAGIIVSSVHNLLSELFRMPAAAQGHYVRPPRSLMQQYKDISEVLSHAKLPASQGVSRVARDTLLKEVIGKMGASRDATAVEGHGLPPGADVFKVENEGSSLPSVTHPVQIADLSPNESPSRASRYGPGVALACALALVAGLCLRVLRRRRVGRN